jgi:hypothetical protein
MFQRLSILTVAMLLTAATGCATSAQRPAETASVPTARCGAPIPVEKPAVTVEGFGGGGETLLLVERRQPREPCVSPSGSSTGIALAGQQ